MDEDDIQAKMIQLREAAAAAVAHLDAAVQSASALRAQLIAASQLLSEQVDRNRGLVTKTREAVNQSEPRRASCDACAPVVRSENLSNLTPREIQVLTLIGAGKRAKQIAVALGVTTKTVVTHKAHIMDKLGIHEGPSLLRFAIRNGLSEL